MLRSFLKTAPLIRLLVVFTVGALPGVAAPPATPAPLWDGFRMGVSYYPEQWPEDRWDEDFRKMADIGFTVVRMGEFAWARFEPAAGKFDFAWMDRAIRKARSHGIEVILCTPTASVPPWLYQQHPDVLGANEKGPFTYGGRKGFSPDSPAMREATKRVVTAMAEHFADNPSVIGWQLSNEPGHPFVNYDAHALKAFREWLKQRHGTIENLNAAWGGNFWSNRYDSWDQIMFPINGAEGGWRPPVKLDYRRHFSDAMVRWLRFEADLLRPHTGNRFVFTNWPETRLSVDVHATSPFLDLAAWDNYAQMPGIPDFREQYYAALNHDICRGARPDQRFLIAEQATQVPANGHPKGVRLQTYMDLAHGAAGSIYFQWRPPLAGEEQGYVSMLQPDGSFGPSEPEFRRMKEEFARLGPLLADSRTEADVAMLFSYDNNWDQGFWTGTTTGYDQQFLRYYAGCKRLGRNVDVIAPGAKLDRYRVLVAPGLQIVSDELAAQLKSYVENGGILVIDVKAGTREPRGGLREMVGPGVFADIAGIRVTAPGSLQIATSTYQVCFGENGNGFPVNSVFEGIELRGAESWAAFRGQGMAGRPAVTMNKAGRGHVLYVAADTREMGFHERLFEALAGRFRIEPILDVPVGVEVVSRVAGDRKFVFLLNLTRESQVVPLPAACKELIEGQKVRGKLQLPPYEVAILEF